MRSFVSWLIVGLLTVMAVTACSSSTGKTEDWQITPTFDVVGSGNGGSQIVYPMRGERERFGFIDTPFIAGMNNKYMWHFWGKSEDLGRDLKVVGVSQADGTRIEVLETTLGGPNIGAAAHAPSMMSLPTAGLWRLDVYLDGKLYGTMVVEGQVLQGNGT